MIKEEYQERSQAGQLDPSRTGEIRAYYRMNRKKRWREGMGEHSRQKQQSKPLVLLESWENWKKVQVAT